MERKACGFVMVREGASGYEYLLLTNRQRLDAGLPKGHAEPGEDDELATALRETEEETTLTDFEPVTAFRRVLEYPSERGGQRYDKTVVYFLARWHSGDVVLSDEHTEYRWASLEDALYALPYPNLRGVVRDASLWLKDPALFDLEPWTEADALHHLREQPAATDALVAHLKGGARLARVFAQALVDAGVRVHVEATAAGTALHDFGRALGEHADHPRAGLKHLRGTAFAPYAFACMSHFTKGAAVESLVDAGVDAAMLDEAGGLVDLATLTWEERCAALADACMKQDRAVPPTERFADLRQRYDAGDLIALQETRTAVIQDELAAAIGRDPLSLVGLA